MLGSLGLSVCWLVAHARIRSLRGNMVASATLENSLSFLVVQENVFWNLRGVSHCCSNRGVLEVGCLVIVSGGSGSCLRPTWKYLDSGFRSFFKGLGV